jgi:MarR family transcriptional regulator, organic hydroperoxide resistance regulator
MPDPNREIEEALGALQQIQRTVMASTWGRWADLDLTVNQVKALHILGQCGELTVGALAERQGRKLPAASVLADNLVQAGLVERSDDPEDRRRVQLRLTARGEEIVQRPHEVGELMRSWIERLDREDVRALAQGLRALASAAAASPAANG